MAGRSDLVSVLLLLSSLLVATRAAAQEVVVFGGPEDAEAWLIEQNWWGEDNRAEQLEVPRALITGINPSWRQTAQNLTVAEKKEVFYRFILPLAVHANEMVLDRRQRLLKGRETAESVKGLAEDQLQDLRSAAVLLRVLSPDEADALEPSGSRTLEVIDSLLYRLDVIPPGLVLAQAAYESGYGTSRFAIDGN
ncbi:MAG TPA: hypothetical protein VLT59_10960, partial [Steroidobacteraceae bacterium]|nr:hypothetical protein [Steroidobacteraceae bacterium]